MLGTNTYTIEELKERRKNLFSSPVITDLAITRLDIMITEEALKACERAFEIRELDNLDHKIRALAYETMMNRYKNYLDLSYTLEYYRA